MKQEEKQKEIKMLKEKFSDNETFKKNGITYHRFVIQKIDYPKELGKRYITINFDKDNIPYAVLTVYEGMSKEEKERRKAETQKRRQERKEAVSEYNAKIKAEKKKLREAKRDNDFTLCQDIKERIETLKQEKKQKFGRKSNK